MSDKLAQRDDPSATLALIDRAREALAKAQTIPEIRTVKEWVGLAADAARRQRRLATAQEAREKAIQAGLDACELRIHAYGREGDLLQLMTGTKQRRQVGRPHKKSQGVTNYQKALRDLGYQHRMEPARAIEISEIPEAARDAYFAKMRKHGEPSTVAGILNFAADWNKRMDTTTPPVPKGKHRTIVIDPPWPMDKSGRTVAPEQGGHLDYPTMTLEQIKKLKAHIDECTIDPAHLYLWTTQNFLSDSLEIVEEWGFTYHCLLTWVKPGGFAPFSFMFNAEHAIFAYRGAFEMQQLGLKIAFSAPTAGHSIKPDKFFDLVEQASFEPRVEFFARRPRPGWTTWGDEA